METKNVAFVGVIVIALMCRASHSTSPPPLCRPRWIAHRIELPNCVEKRLLSLACRGACESYSQYVPELDSVESVCNCCQAEGKTVRRIRMTCRVADDSDEMETRIAQVVLPTGCMCRPCVSTAESVPDVINEIDETAVEFLATASETDALVE